MAGCGDEDSSVPDVSGTDAAGVDAVGIDASGADTSGTDGSSTDTSGPGPSATLLFRSGFESDVAILPLDYDPLNLGYSYLRGGDVPPFIWGDGDVIGDDPFTGLIESYGDRYGGIHVLGTNKALTVQELIRVRGYDGSPTTVLRQKMEGVVNEGLQQCPYQINEITNIPDKTYIRYKLRYDDLDELLNSGGVGNNRMLWQYKSEDWGDGLQDDGQRSALTLVGNNDGSGDVFWVLNADIGVTGGHPERVLWSHNTSEEPDPSMGLNVDGWNLIEIVIDWSSTETGGIKFRLNNVVVFDLQNVTTLGATDTGIQFLTLWQFYSVDFGTIAEQWIDDVEIWSDDPARPYVPPE